MKRSIKSVISLTIILVTLISLIGCSNNSNTIENEIITYKIDKESYEIMIKTLLRYGSSNKEIQSLIEDAYKDYIELSVYNVLQGIKSHKVYEVGDVSSIVLYENSGNDVAYPIFTETGKVEGYGTYEEHKESYDNFCQIELNEITRIDYYENMILCSIYNKYNGAYTLRLKLNNTGKISSAAIFK